MNVNGVDQNSIILTGICTHNLKNLSIEIPKYKITTIYGRSGAGKTSLAFTTLHQLCQDEFDSLENGFNEANQYQVESYKGIIPSISINQLNKNNNPRSTLYSYLNISQILSSSSHLNIKDYSLLKLNNPNNICPYCNGLGEIVSLNEEELIDESKTIFENPFKIWQKGNLSDLYHQLLISFCKENNIPDNIPYKSLPESQKNKLLYTNSETKLVIRYKLNGKKKQRRLFYKGMLNEARARISLSSMADFKNSQTCSECLGSRVNSKLYLNFSIFNMPFKEFITMPFDKLKKILSSVKESEYLKRMIDSFCELGLGYLSFARSIPSLSGGELQRVKFSRILNSNISGVLFVIDEISSQVNTEHFQLFLKKLKDLSKKNTVLLVEHNQYFIDNSDYKIHIGKNAGKYGGYICEHEKIEGIPYIIEKHEIKEFFEFRNINKNNVIEQSFSLPKKAITLFSGVSGSGKSSIARWLEQNYKAIYITQKLANFTSRSILASTLKLNILIANIFEKYTGIKSEEFLLHKNAGCECCQGTGVIKYERGYDKDIYLTCHHCNGELFKPDYEYSDVKVNNLSICDFYREEISILLEKLPREFSDLVQILESAKALGLGHLNLARKTQTLSGGENRRIKLCEHLSRKKETKKILIIDEPLSGLDPETASNVAYYIYQKSDLFSAVILIEHRKEIKSYVDYEIKIGPFAGEKGGEVLLEHKI